MLMTQNNETKMAESQSPWSAPKVNHSQEVCKKCLL